LRLSWQQTKFMCINIGNQSRLYCLVSSTHIVHSPYADGRSLLVQFDFGPWNSGPYLATMTVIKEPRFPADDKPYNLIPFFCMLELCRTRAHANGRVPRCRVILQASWLNSDIGIGYCVRVARTTTSSALCTTGSRVEFELGTSSETVLYTVTIMSTVVSAGDETKGRTPYAFADPWTRTKSARSDRPYDSD